MIAITTLIRNRKHVLPYFLQSILSFNYDKKDLRLVWVINNNEEPEVIKMLEDFKIKHENKFAGIHEINVNIPDLKNLPAQSRIHGDTENHKIMIKSLALLRNMALELVRNTQADYMLSLDSDIILEPEGINKLMSSQYDHVSGLVYNDASSHPGYCFRETRHNKNRFINAGMQVQNKGKGIIKYRNLWTGISSLKGERQVDGTGACFLVDMGLAEEAGYNGFFNWGEDGNFCESLYGNIGISFDVETIHLMESKKTAIDIMVKEAEDGFKWFSRSNFYQCENKRDRNISETIKSNGGSREKSNSNNEKHFNTYCSGCS